MGRYPVLLRTGKECFQERVSLALGNPFLARERVDGRFPAHGFVDFEGRLLDEGFHGAAGETAVVQRLSVARTPQPIESRPSSGVFFIDGIQVGQQQLDVGRVPDKESSNTESFFNSYKRGENVGEAQLVQEGDRGVVGTACLREASDLYTVRGPALEVVIPLERVGDPDRKKSFHSRSVKGAPVLAPRFPVMAVSPPPQPGTETLPP